MKLIIIIIIIIINTIYAYVFITEKKSVFVIKLFLKLFNRAVSKLHFLVEYVEIES
jgi:hypothetical protein